MEEAAEIGRDERKKWRVEWKKREGDPSSMDWSVIRRLEE
jgi:hypothetical protein